VKTRDLDAELERAQRALTTEHHKQLAALGIPFAVTWRGLVGVVRIELSSDGRTYWPAEDGAEAYITPARIGEDPSSPESADFESVPQYGGLVDLIAWSSKFPGRWATRCDSAVWLGAIPPQYITPPPVVVRRDVFSWLRNDARGLAFLGCSSIDAYRVLSICGEIEAEDFRHAAELRRILAHPFSIPTISISGRAPGRRAA
jgi:hypothetical protein